MGYLKKLLDKIREIKKVDTFKANNELSSIIRFEEKYLLEYIIRNSEIVLKAYIGNKTNIILTSQIDGFPDTLIGKNAFKNKGIESIIIPVSVTVVGKYSFV